MRKRGGMSWRSWAFLSCESREFGPGAGRRGRGYMLCAAMDSCSLSKLQLKFCI